MNLCSSTRRSLLLAGTIGSFVVAWPLAAQQPPAPSAEAPPPWAQGRPAQQSGAAKLAPVAPPAIPTAADQLPTAKLTLPRGFNIELYASGVDNARSLRVGDKGTVFVGSRLKEKVHAIVEKGGKREVKVIASGLYHPNGLAFHNGTLYIAELSQISKIEKIEDNLDNPPKPVVIYDDLPKDEPHGWKFLAIGPDGKLYFQVGAPCNICTPPDTHAQLRRINLDGSGMEVIARGIRQTVGFDWHPVTKELWFTENQRDWLSEDAPQDKLNRMTKIGQHFGFPFCHQGNLADQEFGWGRSCDEFVKPALLLGPHSAPLGMRFYTGKMFPAAYRDAIIVVRHGSWNRSKKIGGDIVVVRLNKDGTVKPNKDGSLFEPLITGFLVNNNYIGRPADVEVMKDGSLLVSDDFNGAARASFPAHMGRASSCAVHIGGDVRPSPARGSPSRCAASTASALALGSHPAARANCKDFCIFCLRRFSFARGRIELCRCTDIA